MPPDEIGVDSPSIYEQIKTFVGEHDDGDGVDVDRVYDGLLEDGFDRSRIGQGISYLKRQGEIYEPYDDALRVTDR